MGAPRPSDADKGGSLFSWSLSLCGRTPQTSHPVLLLRGRENQQLWGHSGGDRPAAGGSPGEEGQDRPPVPSRQAIMVFLTRQGKKIKSPGEQSNQAEPGIVRDASVDTAAMASRQAGSFLIIDGAYK